MNREEAVNLLLSLVETGGLRGRAAIVRETAAYIRNLDGVHTTQEYKQVLRRRRKIMNPNFDTEIELKAYEFCVNWLRWNFHFNQHRQEIAGAEGVRTINMRKQAADASMQDLFRTVLTKYELPKE